MPVKCLGMLGPNNPCPNDATAYSNYCKTHQPGGGDKVSKNQYNDRTLREDEKFIRTDQDLIK
jgi:hypothetical protein